MKFCYIIFLLGLIPGNIFAQASTPATISATIVNSVGAENSGDINFGHFYLKEMQGTIAITSDGIRTSSAGIKLNINENASLPYINVIGSDYVYDISVQRSPVIFNNSKGNMRVDLFNAAYNNNDITNFPINAILTVSDFKNAGEYSSTFNVTVNFN